MCSLANATKSVASRTRATSSSTMPMPRTVPRGSVLQMPREELEEDLGPLDPVAGRARPGQLMALAREADHLDLATEQPQGDEQRFGLAGRTPQVTVGV